MICTFKPKFVHTVCTFKPKFVHTVCTFKSKFVHTVCTFKAYLHKKGFHHAVFVCSRYVVFSRPWFRIHLEIKHSWMTLTTQKSFLLHPKTGWRIEILLKEWWLSDSQVNGGSSLLLADLPNSTAMLKPSIILPNTEASMQFWNLQWNIKSFAFIFLFFTCQTKHKYSNLCFCSIHLYSHYSVPK